MLGHPQRRKQRNRSGEPEIDIHIYRLKVYYGDTDFTGVVYYANYFRFFECARSESLGPERLRQDYDELGVGLVVYKTEATFLKGARYGDELEIRSRGYTEGEYRLFFDQTIHRDRCRAAPGEVHDPGRAGGPARQPDSLTGMIRDTANADGLSVPRHERVAPGSQGRGTCVREGAPRPLNRALSFAARRGSAPRRGDEALSLGSARDVRPAASCW